MNEKFTTKDFEETYLNEEKILLEDRVFSTNGILVSIDADGMTDRKFDKDPYFKVYNKESWVAAGKVARIYFYRPEYVEGHKTGRDAGKQSWYFSSGERKLIDRLLTINWANMMRILNKKCPGNNFNIQKIDYTQLPDKK